MEILKTSKTTLDVQLKEIVDDNDFNLRNESGKICMFNTL